MKREPIRMQKIDGLKTKCINVTEAQIKFAKKEMKKLKIKTLSEYMRFIIDERKKSK